MTDCPECGAKVAIPAAVETGEIIDCGTCNAELEVISLDPPVIDMAPELEEDWGE